MKTIELNEQQCDLIKFLLQEEFAEGRNTTDSIVAKQIITKLEE